MRTLTLVAGIFLAGLANSSTQYVGDFALLDHEGSFHQLSYYGDQRAVVYIVQANNSANVNARLGEIHALRDAFAGQPVVFYMLNPLAEDSRQAIAAHAQASNIDLPILVDETQLVSESLGITQVGEILIIDPAKMNLAYRGNLEDLAGVESALNQLLAGEAASSSTAENPGAKITYAASASHAEQPVSYSQDIAPILQENCVQCHREGGIGPWAMSNHAMVQGWSAMMREVVMTKRMPPGQVDPHVGKELLQPMGLSNAELQKLVHWIDAGAPGDAQNDPLAGAELVQSKFSFGEPDLVYTIPAQDIPATGIVDYRYVPVELNLDRDVWVRAMEFLPGDAEVLHHVIAYVSSPADKTVRGRATGAAQGESVGGFAPGRPGDVFRDNSGRLIRKGSNLLLQIHYTTSGRATVDETEIGIYIYDEPPAYVMSGGVAGQRRFLVPPHAKDHKLEGAQEIERDAYLYDLMPHMHYRGKYMSYTAEYPDGSSEILLSVPKYNFNWQFNYALKDPLFLPAGTRLIARGAMDNSDRNPANPNPNMPVHFGLQTKHEMFFGFTTLRYAGDTPDGVMSKRETDGRKDDKVASR